MPRRRRDLPRTLAAAAETRVSQVAGDHWTFREPLGELRWDLGDVRGPRRKILRDLVGDERIDEEAPGPAAKAAGVYSSGKKLFRLAALAQAAHVAGDPKRRDAFSARLADELAPWLAFDDASSLLVYDAKTGGIVTRAGFADPNADFGNGKYNDHHFHYGYGRCAWLIPLR